VLDSVDMTGMDCTTRRKGSVIVAGQKSRVSSPLSFFSTVLSCRILNGVETWRDGSADMSGWILTVVARVDEKLTANAQSMVCALVTHLDATALRYQTTLHKLSQETITTPKQTR